MNTWLDLDEKGQAGMGKSRNKRGGQTSVANAFLYSLTSK